MILVYHRDIFIFVKTKKYIIKQMENKLYCVTVVNSHKETRFKIKEIDVKETTKTFVTEKQKTINKYDLGVIRLRTSNDMLSTVIIFDTYCLYDDIEKVKESLYKHLESFLDDSISNINKLKFSLVNKNNLPPKKEVIVLGQLLTFSSDKKYDGLIHQLVDNINNMGYGIYGFDDIIYQYFKKSHSLEGYGHVNSEMEKAYLENPHKVLFYKEVLEKVINIGITF